MVARFLNINTLEELKSYFDKLSEQDKTIAAYLFWKNFEIRSNYE